MDERDMEIELARAREKEERRRFMEAIRSVLVQRGDANIFYQCAVLPGGTWACGYCHAGMLGTNPQKGDYCSCGAVVNSVERGPAPKMITSVFL